VFALAISFLAHAESPSSDDLPLPDLFSADKRYPLERLSSEMYMLDPGMIPGDMMQTPQTPSERLEGLRAIWPNVNVWSDAAPLLTGDFGRLAPGPVAGLRPDGDKHVAKSNTDFEWAALNSKISVRDRDTLLDPSRRSTWETDETVKMPVAGPLFLFGQLGASTPAVEEQQHKWLGRTGVGLKLRPWFLEEVQVRGGPVMRYDATSKKAGQSPERSELFLEAVTKLPLPVIGPLKVEYTSFAVPAGTASERGQINQDFKLAKPFRGDNEIHLGAKYHTEDSSSPTPWVDRMQLYMGVQFKH
jgi:hypothetical protein